MRTIFKLFWLPFYRRWALWYIQRERRFEYAGLQLKVQPGVFHPGVFFSTLIFIDFLQHVDFQNKRVLDVGTGSGLLALFAAKKGAMVTALDIHPKAVETATRNGLANGFEVRSNSKPADQGSIQPPITLLESDLFDRLPHQPFDLLLINPPYYPRQPIDFSEHAFFAGENLEYFEKLFASLHPYLQPQTQVWMILSEDCNFMKMKEIADRHGYLLQVVFEQKKWGERFFVAQADPI